MSRSISRELKSRCALYYSQFSSVCIFSMVRESCLSRQEVQVNGLPSKRAEYNSSWSQLQSPNDSTVRGGPAFLRRPRISVNIAQWRTIIINHLYLVTSQYVEMGNAHLNVVLRMHVCVCLWFSGVEIGGKNRLLARGRPCPFSADV